MKIFNEKKIRVAVILVNWNGANDTLACLSSLENIDTVNFDTYVIDNGSTDDSVVRIRSIFPDLRIIETGANLGFSGGNNVGIDAALADNASHILLLNNDTVVDPSLIEAFLKAENSLDTSCILGAKTYFFDEPETIWYAGGHWDSNKLKFIHIGSHQIDEGQFSQVQQTDYVTGCTLFCKADVFHQVGLLDDHFFLTYEETDWCYRAKSFGIDCYVVPTAKVWHKVSASFGGNDSPLRNYFMSRNLMLWGSRHLDLKTKFRLHWRVLRQVLSILFPPLSYSKTGKSFFKNIAWSASSWFKAVKRSIGNASNQATLLGYKDFYLRRLGDCPAKIRSLRNS